MSVPPGVLARGVSARGELVLRRRYDDDGPVWELRANGVFVMDTAETSSERALARYALDLVATPGRVLIGGLGLGFTAAEVLADPRVEHCRIVEIEPELVAWAREDRFPGGAALLSDPRLTVTVADIAEAVAAVPEPAYDLALLDVDNGPGYLVHDANAELYGPDFLARLTGVLRPGGVAVVWSAAREPSLLSALADVAARAEEIDCPVTLQGRTEHYWLYAAHVPPRGGGRSVSTSCSSA